MSSRYVWEHEQNNLAEYIFGISLNFLGELESKLDNSSKTNWFFWRKKQKSKRELFQHEVDVLQRDRYGAIGMVTILNSTSDIGIFPKWGNYSVWAAIPENRRKEPLRFTPDPYIGSIFDTVSKDWFVQFEKGESSPRDLLNMVYKEVFNYQLNLSKIENLRNVLSSNDCDLDDLLLQVDRLFASSKKRVGNIVRCGQVMWHTGVFSPPPTLNNYEPLWLTRDISKNSIYVGQNKSAIANGLTNNTLYTIEAIAMRDLVAADFSGTSFSKLRTINNNDVDHPIHSLLLKYWAELNSFDALVGTNKVDDEVVICNPAVDLTYKVIMTYTPPIPQAAPAPAPAHAPTPARHSLKDPAEDNGLSP